MEGRNFLDLRDCCDRACPWRGVLLWLPNLPRLAGGPRGSACEIVSGKRDTRSGVLSLQTALRHRPDHLEAHSVAASLLEASGSPEALLSSQAHGVAAPASRAQARVRAFRS